MFECPKAELETPDNLGLNETTVRVLDSGRGKTRTGYLWKMARDERGWSGPDPPGVVHDHAPGRGGQHGEKRTCVVNQWDGLLGFLHDGRVEMDSSFVENRNRPIQLTAKDALYAGREKARPRGAASLRTSKPRATPVRSARHPVGHTSEPPKGAALQLITRKPKG